MKGIVREKRKLSINGKRINPDKIRELAQIVNREAQQSLITSENVFLIFSVDATDNSSYESQSTIIFDKNQLIEKKVIQKINMRYNTLDYGKNIEIQLLHSQLDENKENYILVSGDDPIWVNGIISELSECIEFSENQTNKNALIGWSVLFIWICFIVLYGRLVYTPLRSFENSWIQFFGILVIPGISIYYADALNKYLQTLSPKIELQTGPDYMRITQKKRKKVEQVFLLIIIPLFLAALYDIFKSIVLK